MDEDCRFEDFANVPCSGQLVFGADPFAQDMYDDNRPMWICEGHIAERAAEV